MPEVHLGIAVAAFPTKGASIPGSVGRPNLDAMVPIGVDPFRYREILFKG
jgi:hypothetical protein